MDGKQVIDRSIEASARFRLSNIFLILILCVLLRQIRRGGSRYMCALRHRNSLFFFSWEKSNDSSNLSCTVRFRQRCIKIRHYFRWKWASIKLYSIWCQPSKWNVSITKMYEHWVQIENLTSACGYRQRAWRINWILRIKTNVQVYV